MDLVSTRLVDTVSQVSFLWKLAFTLIVAVPLGKWYLAYRNARNKTRHIPGTLYFSEIPFFDNFLGSLAPNLLESGFWCPDPQYILRYRYTAYKNLQARIFSRTSLFGKATVITSDPKAFRYVLANEDTFPKDDVYVKFANMMGESILGTSGDAWKRHRRIAASGFSQDMYQRLWSTTVELYKVIVEKEKWIDSDSVLIPNANDLTRKLSISNVALCLFGDTLTWDVPHRYEDGNLSTFGMIRGISENIILKIITPRWMYSFGLKRLKDVDDAYNAFHSYVHDRVKRRAEQITDMKKLNEDVDSDKTDLLGALVHAFARNNEERLTMNMREVLGNMFIFCFSGHESTAQNLCVTMAFLGLYPGVQEKVYAQIKSQIQDREPIYEDYFSLHIILACLYESLRRFPAAPFIRRIANKDVTLPVSRRGNPGVVEDVFIQEGTNIMLDLAGHGVDPDFFPNPDEFDPFRWIENKQDEEHMLTFGYGSHECIGRKFSFIESAAFLVCVMIDWKIEVPLFPDESVEQWQKRVFKPEIKTILTLDDVPVRLVRRKESL